ncbi:MAG TPA: phosphotransferase [Acidimicrobiales bacterium]|nr:phosphotransferase [Acidimicrobiales bacterium]
MDDITYVQKGGGSYHWSAEQDGQPRYFITVDDLDTKPWIGEQRDETFEGLGVAYEVAWHLHHEVGLSFVVSPLRGTHGGLHLRISDQYSMALFPFVDGHAGSWQDPLPDWRRAVLLEDLARLHEARVPPHLSVPRRALDLAERSDLVAALGDLDMAWQGGAFSEPARLAVTARAASVRGWLEELDLLAIHLGDSPDWVLTHGEPHPGNLIDASDGLRLIDWDTVAIAFPERDLWMLHNGSPDSLNLYAQLTGRVMNEAAMRFYQLEWTLSDIAAFIGAFRSPHRETEWLPQNWEAFLHLLDGGTSTPYDLHDG